MPKPAKPVKPASELVTTPETKADIYADPLVYDILHAEDTARDARVIEKLTRQYVPNSGLGAMRLLEPASGTGRYQIALARRGHHTTGIDLDSGMLAFARQRAQEHEVSHLVAHITADMRTFAPPKPRCNAAFNLINSIRHLLSDAAMAKHMAAVGKALVPGGVYIVGIELIDRVTTEATEDIWMGHRGSLAVHQLINYLPPDMHGGPKRREQVVSSVTVRNTRTDASRQIDSAYWLRTYTPAEWTSLVYRCGWEVIGQHTSSGAPMPLRPYGYRLCILRQRAGDVHQKTPAARGNRGG